MLRRACAMGRIAQRLRSSTTTLVDRFQVRAASKGGETIPSSTKTECQEASAKKASAKKQGGGAIKARMPKPKRPVPRSQRPPAKNNHCNTSKGALCHGVRNLRRYLNNNSAIMMVKLRRKSGNNKADKQLCG
mmetsp:Transcript_10528/g.23334  ORF Transcript_10528/g.23334 Transcript_10528/m.23334 type:complete len:133 (+) Transcript_10528:560-958(+)